MPPGSRRRSMLRRVPNSSRPRPPNRRSRSAGRRRIRRCRCWGPRTRRSWRRATGSRPLRCRCSPRGCRCCRWSRGFRRRRRAPCSRGSATRSTSCRRSCRCSRGERARPARSSCPLPDWPCASRSPTPYSAPTWSGVKKLLAAARLTAAAHGVSPSALGSKAARGDDAGELSRRGRAATASVRPTNAEMSPVSAPGTSGAWFAKNDWRRSGVR